MDKKQNHAIFYIKYVVAFKTDGENVEDEIYFQEYDEASKYVASYIESMEELYPNKEYTVTINKRPATYSKTDGESTNE